MLKRWIRSTDAAALLGVSQRTLLRLAESGAVPARRYGFATWWLFDRAVIEQMASLTTPSTTPPEPPESDHEHHDPNPE